MTQPPEGYPASEPGSHHPPPADPFYGPPSWEPPTQPTPGHGSAPPGGYPPPPPGGGYPPPPGPGQEPPTQPFGPPAYGPPPDQPPQYGPPPGPPPYGPTDPQSPPYGAPGEPPPYGPPPGPPPYGPGGPYDGPPPNKRRGLVIVAIALAGVLVLCTGVGVGAWLFTRGQDEGGAASPAAAAQSFLQTVYRDRNAAAAADLVCAEARDEEKLAEKINELNSFEEGLADPRFQWTDPAVVEERSELTVVGTTVTVITSDEKTSEQTLHISVLDKGENGWWVCDVETVEAPDETPPAEEGGDEEGDEQDAGDEEGGEEEDEE